MGTMNEMAVALQEGAFKDTDFGLERFNKRAKGMHHGKTEAEINTGFSFVELYAGIYEGDYPTNRIVNVAKPWDVRMSWRVCGPLRELICGKWCCSVHFESIGKGKEFDLHYPHIEFNCRHECYSICIPGDCVTADDCSTPYKVVATVQYESMCCKPGPILGFVDLGLVQFYHSAV